MLTGDLLVSGGNRLLIETNFKGASSSRNVTVSLRPQGQFIHIMFVV